MTKHFIRKIKTAIGIIRLFKNWPTFFLHYFKIKKGGDVLFKFRNGLKWHVDVSKRGFAVIVDVWLQQPYGHINKLKNPKVIFDIGAHIGSFSIMAAKKYPEAKIYAFEASKENFALLEKNIKENKIKNIEPFNLGVTGKNGILNFYISGINIGWNSFVKGLQKNVSKSYKVKCEKISSIFSKLKIKKCDFLKMDIEGMELEVIKSAYKDKMLNKIENMAMELGFGSPEIREGKKFLSKHGFKVYQKKDIVTAVKK